MSDMQLDDDQSKQSRDMEEEDELPYLEKENHGQENIIKDLGMLTEPYN
jgi:hypothetical protein